MLLVKEMKSGASRPRLKWAVGARGDIKKKLFQPNNMLRASGTKTSTGRWPVLG